MKHPDQNIGDAGEEAATSYLTGLGYTILARKYRKKIGEVDIVAQKADIIHFVEVKTSVHYPDSGFLPEIRVDRKKAAKLRRTCEIYLSETKASPDQRWQIDVISVILNADSSLNSMNHFENAVFDNKYCSQGL